MPVGAAVQEASKVLRRWLADSGLKSGERLPSERSLAQILGLKHNTVNRAMTLLIAEGLVQRQGYKLSFTPDLSPPPPPSIPLDVVLNISPPLVRSFRKLARELGIEMRLHCWEGSDEVMDVLHRLDTPQTMGVLLKPPYTHGASVWEPAMTRLMSRGIPCVTIAEAAADIPAVLTDNALTLDRVFSYLGQLGHHRLALSALQPWSPNVSELLHVWKMQCYRPGFRNSAQRIFCEGLSSSEKAKQLVDKLKGPWNRVTALIVHDTSLVSYLIPELNRAGIKVPEDLSIVGLVDGKPLQTVDPPITGLSFGSTTIEETAFHLLQRLVRKKAETGTFPTGERLRMGPIWCHRASVAALHTKKTPLHLESTEAPTMEPPVLTLDENPWRRKAQVDRIVSLQYDRTRGLPSSRFASIDLQKLVNRPLNFRRGWLGDRPLRHLPAGEYRFHGVPFQILGGNRRTDCGAIVFHSANNIVGCGRLLPDAVRIPICRPALAVYVLHGCGYAQYLGNFATYAFHGKTGLIGQVPLVSLGPCPPATTPELWEEQSKKANIQDWWPDFPHCDFPTGRRVLLLGSDAEPVQSHRYIYTLEWVNPHPEEEVAFLEVQVDRRQQTTLGILGISVLLPPVHQ